MTEGATIVSQHDVEGGMELRVHVTREQVEALFAAHAPAHPGMDPRGVAHCALSGVINTYLVAASNMARDGMGACDVVPQLSRGEEE